MSTIDITVEGDADAIRSFSDQVATLLAGLNPDETFSECEIILDESCPHCKCNVVGTTLSDGSISYYCLNCDADLTGGPHGT